MPQKYTLLMRSIHWLMALLILGTIAVGWYMDGLPDEAPNKYQIYDLHKSFGVTILVLAVLRLVVRAFSQVPAAPNTLATWEIWLSKIAVFLMYALMIVVPLTGFLMSDFADFPVKWFGIELPGFVDGNKDYRRLMHQFHGIVPYILLGIIGLHLAGSIKHRFIDKDPESDVLKRML